MEPCGTQIIVSIHEPGVGLKGNFLLVSDYQNLHHKIVV